MINLVSEAQILEDSLSLFQSGWTSNIYYFNVHQYNATPCAFSELYLDILSQDFVSKPCWNALLNSNAELREIIRCNTHDFVFDFPKGSYSCHRFTFEDARECATFASKVQKSATNKRKNITRAARIKATEGFYDKGILKRLYEIQQGRCYYSGDKLNDKNQTVDHLVPLCEGGTQWPLNLALCTFEMNRKKGGHLGSFELLNILAEKKGEKWAREQVSFMLSVDEKRYALDRDFKIQHGVTPDENDYP
ncbi:hypothetical protein [Marisediminitalea sp.]|uniref:hypothetical protein n=1 Tax=Marisediminitalea sp. TaxID=2662268 RepID=UPI003513C422